MTLGHAFQTAFAHHREGRLAEAEAIYRQIVAADPGHADAIHLLGVIATTCGHFEDAVRLISRAIALRPDTPFFHANLGVALRRLGRLDEAVASLRRAVALAPGSADSHMNLGEVLIETGHVDEAIECQRRALEIRPGFAEAFNNLGNAFAQKRQFADALACHQRAVALEPRSAVYQNNLATSLIESERWEEAAEVFRRALDLAPGFAEARANLANACTGLGRTDEALAHYREAIASQPALAGTHWNFALLLLQLGQFEEGWREYEWRWRHPGFTGRRRDFREPQWNGGLAPGQTILVHAEQGLGDTIQFLRYLPLVRERAQAGRVVLECAESLVRLFEQSGCDGFEIVGRHDWSGRTLPPFDQHVPLLSLPLALGVLEPLPTSGPYLHADADLRAAWRQRLAGSSGLRVGLAWAGNPEHAGDRQRTIPLEKLAPLLSVEGMNFFSLQFGIPGFRDSGIPGFIDLAPHIADFADTAALMMELDLVISADTATAHLAGALGKRAWTLLPFMSDWRWGFGRDDTPWYPAMRLFRQPAPGDWESVVRRVTAELIAPRG